MMLHVEQLIPQEGGEDYDGCISGEEDLFAGDSWTHARAQNKLIDGVKWWSRTRQLPSNCQIASVVLEVYM